MSDHAIADTRARMNSKAGQLVDVLQAYRDNEFMHLPREISAYLTAAMEAREEYFAAVIEDHQERARLAGAPGLRPTPTDDPPS